MNDHKSEERPKKVQDKIRCTLTLFFRALILGDDTSLIRNVKREMVRIMAIIGYSFGRFAFSGLGFNLILALILLVTNFLFLHQFTLL